MSIIKSFHVIFAVLSISGFIYRGFLKFTKPEKLQNKWLKILPHVIDTLLLASAIYLVVASQQYPEGFNWVTAKIGALLLYIVFGLFTLRFSKTRRGAILSFVLALLTFAYIVTVAMTKQAWPLVL